MWWFLCIIMQLYGMVSLHHQWTNTLMIYWIDNCCSDDEVVIDYPKADNLYETSLFDLYDAALFAMLITKLCKTESTL